VVRRRWSRADGVRDGLHQGLRILRRGDGRRRRGARRRVSARSGCWNRTGKRRAAARVRGYRTSDRSVRRRFGRVGKGLLLRWRDSLRGRLLRSHHLAHRGRRRRVRRFVGARAVTEAHDDTDQRERDDRERGQQSLGRSVPRRSAPWRRVSLRARWAGPRRSSRLRFASTPSSSALARGGSADRSGRPARHGRTLPDDRGSSGTPAGHRRRRPPTPRTLARTCCTS
jgi:hypothetical protein